MEQNDVLLIDIPGVRTSLGAIVKHSDDIKFVADKIDQLAVKLLLYIVWNWHAFRGERKGKKREGERKRKRIMQNHVIEYV